MAVALGVSLAIGAVSYLYAKGQADKAQEQAKRDAERARIASLEDARRVTRGSTTPQRLVYGQTRVGGQLINIEATGANSADLGMAMVLAAEPVEEIGKIYVDDKLATDADFTKTETRTEYVPREMTQCILRSFNGFVAVTQCLVDDVVYSLANGTMFLNVQNGDRGIIYNGERRSYQFVSTNPPLEGGIIYRFTDAVSVTEVVPSLVLTEAQDGTQVSTPTFALDSMPSWTTQHVCYGKPLLFIKLIFDDDVFQTGIPKINAEVKGHKVYDPRNVAHDVNDPTTWEWSDNWALCCAHYLMSWHGGRVPSANINWASVSAAADISDELVATGERTVKRLTAGGWVDELIPAGTEKRYTMNGSIQVDGTPLDALAKLEEAGAGRIVESGGVWSIYAGAYDEPELVFDESSLNGGIALEVGGEYSSRVNTVKGSYIDVSMEYQPTDFKVLTSADYVTADNGEELSLDLTLQMTNSPFTASRIGKIKMERSRVGATVSVKLKYPGFAIKVWDTIVLYSERFGWTAQVFEADGVTPRLIDGAPVYGKVFRVLEFTGSPQEAVELALREEQPGIYSWEEGDTFEITPIPLTQLPSPYELAAPTDLTAIEELYLTGNAGELKNRVQVTWNAGDTQRTRSYELWWTKTDGVSTFGWTLVTTTALNAYTIPVVDPGDYSFRVRAVNSLGIYSAYTSITQEILGKTAPPSDVESLSGSFGVDGVTLSWPAVADLDVNTYELRVGDTWESATLITAVAGTRFTWGTFTAGTYTVQIKALDTSNIYSENATSLIVTINAPVKVTAIRPQVLDNYVTLSWADSASTYPISEYIIRRGDTLETSVEVGRSKSTFTVLFEQRQGIFTYWIGGVDIGGNVGEYGTTKASLDSPPDYVLRQDITVAPGDADTLDNMLPATTPGLSFDSDEVTFDSSEITFDSDTATGYILPVDETRTLVDWANLDPFGEVPTFDSDLITMDSDLITMDSDYESLNEYIARTGYVRFIDPLETTALWVKTIDYGALLPATRVTVTPQYRDIEGAVTLIPKIELSIDAVTWEVFDGVYQAVSNSFRYARITLSFTGDGASYGRLDGVQVVLDVKNRTDQGKGVAVSTDVAGTEFFFNTAFADVDSLVPSIVNGADGDTCVLDFDDVPNPTSFMVYCYDINGTRVTRNITWIARGI